MDRQPSKEIFDDIKQAVKATWNLLYMERDLHRSYYHEKVDYLEKITNYSDNWHSLICRIDRVNQRIMLSYLQRKDTKEFLIKQNVHYRYELPYLEA